MRRILSIISAVFLLICTMSSVCFAADVPLVVDELGLLSQEEYQALEKEAESLALGEGCDVAIYITDTCGSMDINTYGDNYILEHNLGQGEEQDVILFVLAMEDREWAMCTSGYAITAFTDAGMDYMSEQIVPYLSAGQYGQGMEAYLSLSRELLNQAHAGTPYDIGYGSQTASAGPAGSNEPARAAGCLGVGLIGSLIPLSRMKKQVKNVAAKSSASDYVKAGSMNVTGSREYFLYRNVAAVPIPRDNNRSGGGGSTIHTTGGHSFGGSHGKF